MNENQDQDTRQSICSRTCPQHTVNSPKQRENLKAEKRNTGNTRYYHYRIPEGFFDMDIVSRTIIISQNRLRTLENIKSASFF